MKVTFHDTARDELANAVAFFNDRSEGLGAALAAEVSSAIEHIVAFGEMGVAVRPGVRRILLRHYPFSLLYNVSADRVRILALMHHRRRPGYWADRL